MTIKDRAQGCLVGLAVGDAVGTTLEFKDRDTYTPLTDMIGGGPFQLNPGEWTDDTSLALALGHSILAKKTVDQLDILTNFSNWYNDGDFSHNQRCFDIGWTTRTSIENFETSEGTRGTCGSINPRDSGNGGIMRLAPVPIFANSYQEAVSLSVEQSITTHGSPDCVETAEYLGGILWNAITTGEYFYIDKWDILNKSRDDISSSGYVVHTAQAALWAIQETNNFKDAILLAANLGDDADTVAAVTGQIAGAIYGYSAIPEEWINKLCWEDELRTMANSLLALRSSN